jgi:hypothetical protein
MSVGVVLLGEARDQQSTRASFLIQAPTEENMYDLVWSGSILLFSNDKLCVEN